MNFNNKIYRTTIKKKLVTLLLVMASVASFATLGDGGKKNAQSVRSKKLMTIHVVNYNYKNFSLKTGYNYRGSNLLAPAKEEKFIMLNTVVSYQRGNATYILPLKRKVILDKIKFNPAPVRY